MAKQLFDMSLTARSDRFHSMSIGARAVYYDIVADADREGFVGSVDSILRYNGIKKKPQVLNELIQTGFLIDAGEGIYYVTHWWQHNRPTELKKWAEKNPTVHTSAKERIYPLIQSFIDGENEDSKRDYKTQYNITKPKKTDSDADSDSDSVQTAKSEKESIAEQFHFYPGYEDEEDEEIAESFMSLEADPLEENIYPFSMDTETAEETVDSDPDESLKEEQTEHERADISNDKGYQEYKLEHPNAIYTEYLLERKRNNSLHNT